MTLKENSNAPDFKLKDETGKERTLAEFKGKEVVLYFYPKDDTPGCTTEACNFIDDYSDYEKAGVVIVGVSPDSPESHAKFKAKFHLPFSLFADVDHKVCELYGVWGKKKMYGREYDGVIRTTFLISSDGKIGKIFENVKPAEHSKEILALS
jgi:peroxiredoxin Q/BCP